MPSRQAFLSGENTNQILQNIIKGLGEYGVDVNIKDLQTKIFNFMNQVFQKYPNEDLSRLNQFVIDSCVKKYMKNNQSQVNQSGRKASIEGQFEEELKSRKYDAMANMNAPPPGSSPPQLTNQQPTTGGMSLTQAISGLHEPLEPQNLDEQNNDQSSESKALPPPPEHYSPVNTNTNTYSGVDQNDEIWLSLSKNDLVNVDGNTFTFCWNRKIVPDFGGDFQVKLKYVTLPKNVPFLLAKYQNDQNKSNNKLNRVYSASGKNYSAKLIPFHTSQEHTTYQALGETSYTQNTLPSTLSFNLISPPNQSLDLNLIQVQKVTKTNDTIKVVTRYRHNLSEQDNLTLEFPKQFTCYKITNLNVINDREIKFSSPFNGYFSGDFKLLRNNWNIDLTLSCRYSRKNN